ncbi:casein kinase I isoform alpha [Trichonephila clavata]|uniref:Casein kinase I isoform alpha n=1 Tax=Trichonephila clavata TaxID=2740835 RepID=A0A8X6J236_TRICU|nr:casein kinase I isoform alpha [Trichonephila clavata]
MLKGVPPGTVGTAHISGWSNAKIFVEFSKHFISPVKCSVNQQVLLLLDNQESHVSIEAITLSKEHGIVMLTFPPHTSHKLQPLDRGVFGPFKKYYSSACSNCMLTNQGKPITIYEVAENVGKSYPLAFTPVNILVGFQNNNFPNEESESNMMELGVYVSTTDAYSEEFCGPSTSNSISCVTPEQIQPFPKAKSRSKTNRSGRKQGRCRILTDTPEKEEIKKQHAINIAKKKLVKKSEFEIKATSSEELSNIENSDSTNDVRNTIEKGGGVCLTRIQGKKHFYVAEIIDVKEEH